MIDLQKWALSELSCLAAVFAFLFLDDKVSALRTPISAAFLHICQVVVQKEEGDEGGFAFPKKHLFTEDLLELVGKSVVQIAHLDMLFSQLLTAENLRAHTMWKSLYYYLEKQRRSKSCAGGEGEGEAMELGEEEQQQQEEKVCFLSSTKA